MTPRRLQLLTFIREYIATNGFSPTYDEMAMHMGHASKSVVHRQVAILIEDGSVCRAHGRKDRNLSLPMPNLVSVPTAVLIAEVERRKADHA